jgi:type 1 glutamine amidotransferase
MRLPAILLLALPLLGQAPPAAPAKIQTLIITGQNGHDWRTVTPLLRKALEDTGRFEVRVTEEFRGAGSDMLAPYDLVVLNYFERRQPALWWGERANDALLYYVRSGKGLVMFHFSVAAFDGWPEYEKLSGANWRPGQGHHSPSHDFVVEVKDPEHPIMKGLPKKMAQPKDELYANLRWQPEGCCQILATAWDDHSLYKNPRQPTPGPGRDQPMFWTMQFGQGRVFATMLGHDGPAVQTPTIVVTFARGAEWAATGKVTLPVPADLKGVN